MRAGGAADAEAAPRTAVVTIARGRRRHLELQAESVARMRPAPDAYVVVAMDPEHPPSAVDLPGDMGAEDRPRVVRMPVADGAPLPLAAARNAGISAAAAQGAELVLCLDADCLAEASILGALLSARRRLGNGHLLAGPVGRLGPRERSAGLPSERELDGSRRAAAAGPRPVPPPGQLLHEPRVELFWSLSFAVSVADHERIGGFDPGYVGYGAEDTDYAFRARVAGVGLTWVGGAWAHHQHHPVSSPPVEHLAEVVANARRFRDRWGVWPMEGWLGDFAGAGLVDWDRQGSRLELMPVRG